MPSGTPVNRQFVVMLKDSTIAIDWGDGLYQDVHSGEFLLGNDMEISYVVTDEQLDWLMRIGRVSEYDSKKVYFYNLPERPQSLME